MMCVVTVVLLIWLLLGSLVGYCCACGYCNDGACGYCCARGGVHTSPKSGWDGDAFWRYADGALNAAVWVLLASLNFEWKPPILFGGYSNGGVNTAVGGQRTTLGVSWFFRFTIQ